VNKFHALCCALLFLPLTYHINSAEVKIDPWNAEKYKNTSSPQAHFAQWALQEFKSKCGGFREEDVVVDLGCGDGKITANIAQEVKNGCVCGIDSSHNMIERAKEDHKRINLMFDCTDMARRTLRYDGVKVVTAFNSIHWIKDQTQVYQNVSRMLQSNGTFVGLISDKDAPIIKAYYNAFEYHQWNSYFKNYIPSYYPSDKESVESLLKSAGLQPIVVEKANIPMMAMEEENFLGVLAATPGVKDAIPQELYMDFMKDVLAEYVKIVPKDETGKVKIDAGLLLILAKKP
jgi:trans-aconitate 2-methyltransferase